MQPVDKIIQTQAAILGSIIADPTCISDIASKINVDMFLTQPTKLLWKCFLELNDEGVTDFDLLTVRDRLGTNWEVIGGAGYFGKIADLEYSATNADRYADSILEFHRKSQISTLCKSMAGIIDTDKSSDEMIADMEKALSTLNNSSTQADLQHAKDIEVSFETDSDEYIATQFPLVNNQIIGLGNGQLIIVMGDTSMGKTSLMLDFFRHITYNCNLPAAYFSCEMSNKENKERLACTLGAEMDFNKPEVSLKDAKCGYINTDQKDVLYEAARQLSTKPMYFDRTPGLDPLTLRRKLSRSVRVHGTRIAFVDHLHRMAGNGAKEGRRLELGSISNAVHDIAVELDIPIVLGAQVNRECAKRDNKKPTVHDIYQCGEVEQQADIVINVFRPSQYGDDGPDEIRVLKGRNCGTGDIPVDFHGKITSFRPISQGQF